MNNLNLPNTITLIRIVMIPFFMLFLLLPMPGGNFLAFLFFVVAAATDGLDGYFARSRNLVTTLGKFLDPLADKFLICAALVCLVGLGTVGVVPAVIIIFRELMVTGLRSIARDAGIVIAASFWGKLKTVSQILAIAVVLLQMSFSALNGWVLGTVLIWISVVFTVWSGYDYLRQCKGLLRG